MLSFVAVSWSVCQQDYTQKSIFHNFNGGWVSGWDRPHRLSVCPDKGTDPGV